MGKKLTLIMLILLFSCSLMSYGQELKPIKLLKPQIDSGRPLMQVLNERKSSRQFSAEELPLQVLSNLLWAAFGINRPESGKRTAPSAVNWQDIDIYVAMAKGLYVYDAKNHILNPVLAQDIRAVTGSQAFVGKVPVNLVYVSDFSKIKRAADEQKEFYSAAHTGFISQNVYLYCASEGLATVVRGLVNRNALAEAMHLRPDQKVRLAQSVGYPADSHLPEKTEKTIVDEWTNIKAPQPPELKSVKIDPKVTALLILDIQNQNCNSERRPRCVASAAKIQKLLAKAREKGMAVVYSLTSRASAADIRKEVAPIEGEPVVKSGANKFFGTDLDKILKEKGITSVIITGTSAHGAVLNTATGAAMRGFKVIVPVDGMSASDAYAEQYTAWHLANGPGSRRSTTLTKISLLEF